MCGVTRIAIVLVLAACKDQEPPPAKPERITCDQFFDKVAAVTKVPIAQPYPAEQLAQCDSFTQNQLRCALDATAIEDIELCSFADSGQRALAAKLTPTIKAQWPGTTTAGAIVAGGDGCALLGLSSVTTPSEQEVAAMFLLRSPGSQPGPPMQFLAQLRREERWRCVSAEPEFGCEILETICVAGSQ